jgi:hypothetical protein
LGDQRLAGGLALSATLGEPALPESTPVVLGVATPDASFLVGLQRVLEALFVHGAGGADGHGLTDPVGGETGCSDREEQVGV